MLGLHKVRGASLLGLCRQVLSCTPRLRQLAIAVGAPCALIFLAMIALWWRLSSGPLELDIATPWLRAAIKENFGEGHEVEIGGTQLERDANGRTSLRIRDIVVRDGDGAVVASAPKAEVGISGGSLLIGRIRAERLSLVGAEMAVRIEARQQTDCFRRQQQTSIRHRVRDRHSTPRWFDGGQVERLHCRAVGAAFAHAFRWTDRHTRFRRVACLDREP